MIERLVTMSWWSELIIQNDRELTWAREDSVTHSHSTLPMDESIKKLFDFIFRLSSFLFLYWFDEGCEMREKVWDQTSACHGHVDVCVDEIKCR